MSSRSAAARLGIALAAANLTLLAGWWHLLPSAIGGHNAYHYLEFPARSQFAAAIVLTLGLGCVYLALAEAWRRSRWRIRDHAGLLVLAPLALGANGVRLQFPSLAVGELGGGAVVAAALLLVSVALLRWPRAATVGAVRLLYCTTPFLFVTLFQAGHGFATHDPERLSPPPAPALAKGEAPMRVVWIVFDELDYEQAFALDHGGDVELGELAALRDEALFATRAYAPAEATLTSLPSLLSGRLFRDSRPAGASRLLLASEGAEAAQSWSEIGNVFRRARERGFDTALAGWTHPYCRLLGTDLNRCFFSRSLAYLESDSLRGALRDQLRLLAHTVPGLVRSLGLPHENAILRVRDYQALHDHARRYAADPRFELVFLHYSIPHLGAVYDRETDSFPERCDCDYLDNLELTNRALGELRAAMQATGAWDRTALLVSSDHWWRRPGARDPRVPFMARLPGAGAGAGETYDQPFNTVLSADLVLHLLEGRLAAPKDVADWIDARRAASRHPWFRFARGGRFDDYRTFDLAKN